MAKTERSEYPICPRCGGPVVGAMMTTSAVNVGGEWYYRSDAVSVYCCSGSCNYDRLVADLSNPPPPAEDDDAT